MSVAVFDDDGSVPLGAVASQAATIAITAVAATMRVAGMLCLGTPAHHVPRDQGKHDHHDDHVDHDLFGTKRVERKHKSLLELGRGPALRPG